MQVERSLHLLVNHFLLEFYCVILLVEIQLLVGNTCNLLCVCAVMNSNMDWAGRYSQYRQAIACTCALLLGLAWVAASVDVTQFIIQNKQSTVEGLHHGYKGIDARYHQD